MRQHLYILTFSFALAACNENPTPANDSKVNTSAAKVISEKLKVDKQATSKKRLSFKNVAQVVQDKESNAWVELKDNSASLALYFNLGYKDTLSIQYSDECWLMYPCKTASNKIIIYWDNNIDSKYDFDIVKAINQVDKKYLHKPFIVLELVNDTTLIATYPIPDLIRKINNSSKERTFFPDKFIVSQAFYL